MGNKRIGSGSDEPPSMLSAKHQGDVFERRVGHLFGLLGYRVEHDVLVAGRQVDLLLEDRSGPLVRQYVVECKDRARPVSTADYDAFCGRVRAAQRELSPKVRGILVSSTGFVKEARAQSQHDDLELITVAELETSVIDFRSYVTSLEAELTGDPALGHFVEPQCRRETLTLAEPVLDLFEDWLRHPTQNQLTLLGDFGTGKTTLLKHIAATLAHRYRQTAMQEGARARVPIYIDLRDYTHAISLKQIILDFLDHEGIRAASYAAFEHVLKEGQVLLLLDGFDEMASRGNYKVTLRNFRELHKNVLGRAKIVLSCRTHYFTTEREVRRFLGEPQRSFLPRSYTDLYRDIAARPNFLLVHLLEFTHEQIETYLRNRCGERWRQVLEFIDSTYNLAELSRRPVLLDMIVTSERRLDPGRLAVSPGLLYQVYTDIWLTTNDWSTVIDMHAKGELLEQLARRLSTGDDGGLPYRELPEMIRAWSPDLDTPSAIEIDRDLRTASFLVRDEEGRYRFSHQSFLEFFYARGLLSDAAGRQSDAWSQPFTTEIYRFLRDLLPEQPDAIDGLLAWLQEPGSALRARINACKCLGAVDEPAVAEGLLRVLDHDPEPEVRAAAASSLAHLDQEGIDDGLIGRARHDEARVVRANSLTSLARRGHRQARDFLLRVLRGEEPEVRIDDRALATVFHAALDTDDPELVAACIERAPRRLNKRSAKSLALVSLDLITRHPTEPGFAYAENLVPNTLSPRLTARAFTALPLARRHPWLDTVLERFREVEERDKSHEHLPELLFALRGLAQDDPESAAEPIFELLDELLCRSDTAIVVDAAFRVVADDFPERIPERVAAWTGRGRPHHLKLTVADYLAHERADIAFDHLKALLRPKERVVTRLGLLRLVYTVYPERFAEVLDGFWTDEATPRVKRAAAERLLRLDRAKARQLLLDSLDDPRVGTRVVACSILGSETDSEVTEALLRVLGTDSAKGLRMQALRSLCAPGRQIERQAILDATADEPEEEVVQLRNQLLGRVG